VNHYDDVAVAVTVDWNDWRSASARLRDLRDVHWFQPTGAPQPVLHGYMSCADVLSGALSHHCDGSSAPHRVRICILKSRNIAETYSLLVRKADEGRSDPCAWFSGHVLNGSASRSAQPVAR
jgi:hypothetical protein